MSQAYEAMTHRDRFVRWMTGQSVDRPPFWVGWGPWNSTWRRWKAEGLPEGVSNRGDVPVFFGGDRMPAVVPVNIGPCPKLPFTRLSEDAETVTFIDEWGIKRRNFKNHESMSEFLEYPVKTRDDWEAFKRTRLDPGHPDRLVGEWLTHARSWMEQGVPIQLGVFPDSGLFGCIRWLMGDEECLLAFYTAPEMLHDMMERMTDIYLTVYGKVVAAGVRVDMIHFWEDMAGRQGPLIGPKHFNEFMAPQYRRVKAFANAHDIPLISVDTDGMFDPIAPAMMEAGVNYIYPLEVAAGCDVNALREKYPTLAFMGGIDKRALAKDKAAIDREIDRVAPALAKGRYIPDLDHLIPDDVSWENYAHYVRRLKALVGKT